MLISIVIERQLDGLYRASAPDLDGCTVTDADAGNAFARIRLAVEGLISDRLLEGQPPPTVQLPSHWRAQARYAGGRWYEVHMNVGHLQAVARHQNGRPKAR